MIQFNLLPDVKIKYINARRQKRLVILVSALVSVGSLGVLLLVVAYIYVIQGAQISDLNSKIKTASSSISNKKDQVDDINKVLTVQNQLKSLDTLHADKPITSRIYDYLAKITPALVTVSKLAVDNNEGIQTISIQGSTNTLETVNKFVDTLKFTTFQPVAENSEKVTVFKDVVLVSFSRNDTGSTYSITLKYDPIIFKSTESASGLVVPEGLITTRSELGRPILQTQTEAQNNAPDPEGGN